MSPLKRFDHNQFGCGPIICRNHKLYTLILVLAEVAILEIQRTVWKLESRTYVVVCIYIHYTVHMYFVYSFHVLQTGPFAKDVQCPFRMNLSSKCFNVEGYFCVYLQIGKYPWSNYYHGYATCIIAHVNLQINQRPPEKGIGFSS